MAAKSRLTIDTDPNTVLRIQEERELPADRQTKMPQTKPASQQNARTKQHPLRRRYGRSEKGNHTMRHAHSPKENESRIAYAKTGGVHGEGIPIPLIEYTHTILHFLQKFKLF